MAGSIPEKLLHKFDVVIIGAGIAGINFAYRLQERLPHLTYAVLESRHEIGGTWSLFKYPGIRSDSDLYTFGFAWRPWPHRSSIAEAPLVKQYMKDAVRDTGIDKHIYLRHRVTAADWSSKERLWELDVTTDDDISKIVKARWLLQCTGYYNHDKPLHSPIPGIESFKGTVIHPQFWPENFDYTNQNVVVIGSGATAVTLIPNMASKASHVTMLQRSPAYILTVDCEDIFDRNIRRVILPWSAYLANLLIRWKWILIPLLAQVHASLLPSSAKRLYIAMAGKHLPSSIPTNPHFTPSYNPWEQRIGLCPDGDFFAPFHSGRASIVTDTITHVTVDEIHLKSSPHAPLRPDVIVTATGLQLHFGGGMKISVDGKPYDATAHFAWKMCMLDDLPNMAFVVGYVDAAWTLAADTTALLVTRMLRRMEAEGVEVVVPRLEGERRGRMGVGKMLKLNSSYVEKGKGCLPMVGDKGQWRGRTWYGRDLWEARFGDLKTDAEWIKA